MIPSVPYYKLSDRIIETFLHLLAVVMIFFSMIDSIYSIDGFIPVLKCFWYHFTSIVAIYYLLSLCSDRFHYDFHSTIIITYTM